MRVEVLTIALMFGCGATQRGQARAVLTLSLDGQVVVDESSGVWSLTESFSDGCTASLLGSFSGATNLQFMASNPVNGYSSDEGFGTQTGTSLQFVQNSAERFVTAEKFTIERLGEDEFEAMIEFGTYCDVHGQCRGFERIELVVRATSGSLDAPELVCDDAYPAAYSLGGDGLCYPDVVTCGLRG